MTDAHLMDADCIHGNTWWECDVCVPTCPNDVVHRCPYHDDRVSIHRTGDAE